MKILTYYKFKDRWWFRIFGYGFAGVSTTSDLIPFSIRNGHKKTIKVFGYYVRFLKKDGI